MSENYNSLGKVNDLKSCKEEIKRLNCKLNECETKIKLFEKQQQKIKTLEKVNSQNSIRLIQCISNVRDLLHSNKLLRQQLNAQKQMRIQAEATVKLLKQQLKFSMTQYQLPMAQIMESSAEQHGTITPKHRNIHKLSKIQKFSKLKLSTKRYSTQIFDLQVESPKKENSKLLMGLSKNFYINQLYNGSEMKKAEKNKKKFSTSLDLRNEQQKYIKAQTRRKRSIQRSLQKQEILQYKPQKQDSALTQNNF